MLYVYVKISENICQFVILNTRESFKVEFNGCKTEVARKIYEKMVSCFGDDVSYKLIGLDN